MSLSQGLYQKQLQKLSPQQIQLMKLLQIPTANLEERIKEEIEENPALEEDEEGHEDEYSEVNDEFKDKDEDDFEPDGSAEEYDNIDISEYVKEGDDDVGDYKLRDDNYPEEDETRQSPHKVETGFNELMVEQLGMLNLDEHNHKVAEQIIGSLDDDGYLRRAISSIVDDLAFRQNIITTDEEIGKLVLQIQQFEPPGIAARNLQECLLLQLERKKDESKAVQLAMKVLEKYHTSYISLTQSELDEFHHVKGDTEGIVNYGLTIKGIVFTAIFIENKEENIIKISFRSQGDFDVNQFARDHFSGGGHINAAGGKSDLTLQETINKFEKLITQNSNLNETN